MCTRYVEIVEEGNQTEILRRDANEKTSVTSPLLI
jgi:hypothetical protein